MGVLLVSRVMGLCLLSLPDQRIVLHWRGWTKSYEGKGVWSYWEGCGHAGRGVVILQIRGCGHIGRGVVILQSYEGKGVWSYR